jgi:GLPGLI family protein
VYELKIRGDSSPLLKIKKMKTYLSIILTILFFNTSYSQNFNGIIIYGKKQKTQVFSKTDSIRAKEDPEAHNRFQKMREIISDGEDKLNFELNFKNNEGYFYLKPILESDNNKSLSMYIGVYDKGIYYNKENRIAQLNAYGELFLITKPKLKWVILKDSKKIGKYNCFKAQTEIIVNSKGRKQKIIAWFTPKIPVSLGPLGYDGLPGLILELEVYKKIYYTKKITLNSKQELKIKKLQKGVKVTEKEFQKIASSTMKKFKKNNGY